MEAAVEVAKSHVAREAEMFADTNHSCYSEGWAAGYLAAMLTVAKFTEDTIVSQPGGLT